MKLNINRKETDVTATTVQELVAELGLPDRGVAVAISNRMVPRASWTETALAEGADVTIIKAAFGG